MQQFFDLNAAFDTVGEQLARAHHSRAVELQLSSGRWSSWAGAGQQR